MPRLPRRDAATFEASPVPDTPAFSAPMIDPFGRHVTYLRVSVTDRCDFRCVYCMSEHMTFLPKKDLLSLEELDRLCSAFVARGVRKLRITGGEPLVRKNIMWLFKALGRHLETGALEELTLTTNGSQLARSMPASSRRCGVRRINVSLDTLDPDQVQGDHALGRSRPGAWPASTPPRRPGLEIKINAVALKGVNEDEIEDLVRFAHGRGCDLTLIETMPLGDIDGDRTDQYPAAVDRARAPARHASRWPTFPIGPAARRAMSRSRRPAAGSASSRR